MEEPIQGEIDISSQGQMINGKPYHLAYFTDRHGNRYKSFISVFEHTKVVLLNPELIKNRRTD